MLQQTQLLKTVLVQYCEIYNVLQSTPTYPDEIFCRSRSNSMHFTTGYLEFRLIRTNFGGPLEVRI